MIWDYFIYFAVAAIILWTLGAGMAWSGKAPKGRIRLSAVLFTASGLAIFFIFILGIWLTLKHPPLRTMGETRLWYSFFLPLVGLIIYLRWRYRWILTFSTLLATVFICVNIFKPEIHTQTLMPALQSPWFAPHVIVYMFAYALMGAATIMAIFYLFIHKPHTLSQPHAREMRELDQLVRSGLAFLTFGMLFGALWAKEAWGHYWSWDPKETWAAITWLAYLTYIHYRLLSRHKPRVALCMLLVAFILLQMCWWGINYLPSAQGISVHTYSS